MSYEGERIDSPKPVMTFAVGGYWLALKVEQVDRVAVAETLWPAPLARPEHAGFFDTGTELVPVFTLSRRDDRDRSSLYRDQLVALLHVRGNNAGLAIERAGRMHEHYWFEDTTTNPPSGLETSGAVAAKSSDASFWLVDADRLFIYDAGDATAKAH